MLHPVFKYWINERNECANTVKTRLWSCWNSACRNSLSWIPAATDETHASLPYDITRVTSHVIRLTASHTSFCSLLFKFKLYLHACYAALYAARCKESTLPLIIIILVPPSTRHSRRPAVQQAAGWLAVAVAPSHSLHNGQLYSFSHFSWKPHFSKQTK